MNIVTNIAPFLNTASDATCLDFGPEWGSRAVGDFSRNCARTVAGARFSGFRGVPKGSPKLQKTASPGNPASRASWKAPRLDFDFILASIFDPQIVLKKHRTSMKHGFDFRTLEGVSSTSGRSGPAECARCVKRSRLGAVAWQGLAQGARRLEHARRTASGGRRITGKR